MASETLVFGLSSALPPKNSRLTSLLHAGSLLIGRYFGVTVDVVIPDRVMCSERTWRRHSAYLTTLYEDRRIG